MVNFDADNQYPEQKIKDLCKPILENKTQYCIGYRNFDNVKDFSKTKKFYKKLEIKFSPIFYLKIQMK